MNRIKILRIITRLNIGGPAIHTVLLTAALEDEQFTSRLIAGRIEANEADMSYLAERFQIEPVYIANMSREIRLAADFRAFREIYRIIKEYKPDIVHTHTAKAGMLGRMAAIIFRVPVIVHTFHGNIFSGYFGKLKTNLFLMIERILARFSSSIIAISKQQRNELLHYRIGREDKITEINLGFQFQNVIPDEEERGKFRERFRVPDHAKLVGIVGRIVPIKNHQLFLEIAEEIVRQCEDVYFAIIGDGELREEIESEISKRNLDRKVFITGFIEDLKPVYADLDLLLLTSNNEGTPVAVIEAMACRKPVLSTRVGGVEDLITDEKSGFYFAPGDKEGFVREIKSWLEQPDHYNEIGEEAYKSVIDRFSAETLIRNMRKHYLELYERYVLQ